MKRSINKALILAVFLMFIYSNNGFAIKIPSFGKMIRITEKSIPKIEEDAVKATENATKAAEEGTSKESEKLNEYISNSEKQGENKSESHIEDLIDQGQQLIQCQYCDGKGYITVQGTRMTCRYCNGQGVKYQTINTQPNTNEEQSEPFWKNPWFIVICCVVVILIFACK